MWYQKHTGSGKDRLHLAGGRVKGCQEKHATFELQLQNLRTEAAHTGRQTIPNVDESVAHDLEAAGKMVVRAHREVYALANGLGQ